MPSFLLLVLGKNWVDIRRDVEICINIGVSRHDLSFQLTAEAPRLVEYEEYLEYEEKEGDPARIQCLYERALQENCLIHGLWLKYTKYLVW